METRAALNNFQGWLGQIMNAMLVALIEIKKSGGRIVLRANLELNMNMCIQKYLKDIQAETLLFFFNRLNQL